MRCVCRCDSFCLEIEEHHGTSELVCGCRAMQKSCGTDERQGDGGARQRGTENVECLGEEEEEGESTWARWACQRGAVADDGQRIAGAMEMKGRGRRAED
ncbi:hypothetical protein HYFRA_00005308 [Hymenoscyphus fraxineus]|uniref:Uncharacterized protein n=1 Tax=Hymenoscyphus fraxineus TaxID=746836 RepID=A0A9N9LCZ7_9HELO|nr:hypothetical protein HYFRA_00005308 [Hymenoscyphus fraxineus]